MPSQLGKEVKFLWKKETIDARNTKQRSSTLKNGIPCSKTFSKEAEVSGCCLGNHFVLKKDWIHKIKGRI